MTFARSARKELQAVQHDLADRILAAVEPLAQEPRPAGCRKLRNSRDLWRIRVGDYRIVYRVDDREKSVDIVIVRHRSDVYR
ncbi:MAG TPA: type II toxin-antitoxin system RelE/ParE family toxin [Thermoanaerobaculia bacterium]|nr:type II toxin-antitoxin system RelE/ParE family toxin [Thermoanaerobaculia bacterium]